MTWFNKVSEFLSNLAKNPQQLDALFTHVGANSSNISNAISELAAVGRVALPIVAALYPPAGAVIAVVEDGLTVGAAATGQLGDALGAASLSGAVNVTATKTVSATAAGGLLSS
jgi:hypothetical protein